MGMGRFAAFIRMLRVHQWLKNAVLLVPLVLSHSLGNKAAVSDAIVAFFLFSLVASAAYIINDIVDLAADRAHPTKRKRALASGDIPVNAGIFTAVCLVVAGIGGGLWLSFPFALSVAVYLIVSLLYSLWLKRVAPLDVVVIGCLFTARIVAGTLVIAVPLSPWLISFSLFFFTALALAKRHSELMQHNGNDGARRGYRAGDWPLTLNFGVGLTVGALVIMLLYVRLEAAQSGLYSRPLWLLATPVIVLAWAMYLWMKSHRGTLHDDPVVFAIQDPWSWLSAALIAGSMALAL